MLGRGSTSVDKRVLWSAVDFISRVCHQHIRKNEIIISLIGR